LLWGVFGASILIMLGIDLGVFHRKSHEIGIKEALVWSAIWIVVAAIFNILIYIWMGSEAAIEFAAGYIVERTLSFDNLFVFFLVFSYFNVPSLYQYRVLFWGILAALVLRGLFVVAGIELIDNFHWIIYLFGAFLIITSLKMFAQKDKDGFDVGKNPVIRLCRRYLPTTDNYDGGSFFLKRAGEFLITPLFIVLLAVETTDIIFAFDSVPAILGITLKPFIVYTSNVFAILGLRALYFALAGCMMMFHYLNYGVTLVLIFIGAKMLLSGIYEIQASVALGIIVLILAISVGLSLVLPEEKASKARSGSNSK
jgi:tellurite resistance protein TerC